MKKIAFSFTLLIGLILNFELQAQDNIYTDRPTQTTSAAIVPVGAFQIETGFYISEFNDFFPGNFAPNLKFQNISINNTLLRYGVSNKLELRFYQELIKSRFITDGSVSQANPLSLAPTFFGVKYNILKNNPKWPDIGVLANLGGGIFDNIGTGLQTEIRLLLDGSLPGELALSTNVGWAASNEFESNSAVYTVVLSRGLNEKLAVFIEAYGTIPDRGPESHSMDAGLTYLLNSSLQLDVYGGTGLSNGSANLLLGFGLSKRFLK